MQKTKSLRPLWISISAFTAVLAATVLPSFSQSYEQGLTFRVYDIGEEMPQLYSLVDGQTPNVDEKRDVIDFSTKEEFGGLLDQFMVKCTGQLQIPEAGTYVLRLTSDDGSSLRLDGLIAIVNDGVHAAEGKELTATLPAGPHPFEVTYFDNLDGQRLLLEWKTPGASEFVTVPASAYLTEKHATRVVAPGKKYVVRAGGGTRPGSGAPLTGVHPSWTVTTIRPESFKPSVSAMAFHPDGRLLVATFAPDQIPDLGLGGDGKIWALTNTDGDDRSKITVTEIASGLSEPLGMAFIKGDLYVSQRLALTKLQDLDGNGSYETKVNVGQGWKSDNYHHFHFGLIEKDGFAYTALSTAIMFDVPGLNGPNPPNRGTLVKTNLATGEVSYIAGGLRTPNGLCVGPEGEIFNTDNQGGWMPTSKLQILKPNQFCGFFTNTSIKTADYPQGGSPSLFKDQPLARPVVFLPQNEIANSPTQPVMFPADSYYAGQMLIGELTLGGIGRVFLEKVNGVWQGCAFRFTQGLEGGVMRLAWGPDGALYAGCMGGTGNWSWNGTTFGLQRLDPKKDKSVAFEMKSVKATSDGVLIEFTKPLNADFAGTSDDFNVKQWTYASNEHYGGSKQGEKAVVVTNVAISEDRKKVRLTLPGLKKGYVVRIKGDPKSAEGEAIWSTETWYTLNEIPSPP